MQLSNVRRIIVEDFPEEERETVSKIAEIVNSFMVEVVRLSQGNISYDNLNRNKVTFDLSVNTDGTPIGVTQVNSGLASFSGMNIINIQSLSGGANVISAPYIDATFQGGGIVKINKIYGIPANRKTRITVEFIG